MLSLYRKSSRTWASKKSRRPCYGADLEGSHEDGGHEMAGPYRDARGTHTDGQFCDDAVRRPFEGYPRDNTHIVKKRPGQDFEKKRAQNNPACKKGLRHAGN